MSKSKMQLSLVKVPPRCLMLCRVPEDWSAERIEVVERTLQGMKDEYNAEAVLVLPLECELEFLSDEDLLSLGLRRAGRAG